MKFLMPFLFVICSISSTAQNGCNCCSEVQSAFHFWLGNWTVYDTTGHVLGTNHIASLEDSCIIQEHWRSKNVTGSSFSYYDLKDSSWNQVWVDNQGGSLVLKGRFVNHRMVLYSKANSKGVYNRVSWYLQQDGSVVQHWEAMSKDGTVKTLFYGIYKRNP